eukprot:tig00020939_g16059.t1
MLEEYYPELLERITNMIEQDIEIQRFDKYQKVFFPMNYDDLVMKTANISSAVNSPTAQRRGLQPGNPFGRHAPRSAGTRGPALPTATPYADQNLLPRVVNPLPALQSNQLATPFEKGRMEALRAKGTVAGMSEASQTAIQTAFQALVRNTENSQITMLAETNARKAEMYDLAARALRPGQ